MISSAMMPPAAAIAEFDKKFRWGTPDVPDQDEWGLTPEAEAAQSQLEAMFADSAPPVRQRSDEVT